MIIKCYDWAYWAAMLLSLLLLCCHSFLLANAFSLYRNDVTPLQLPPPPTSRSLCSKGHQHRQQQQQQQQARRMFQIQMTTRNEAENLQEDEESTSDESISLPKDDAFKSSSSSSSSSFQSGGRGGDKEEEEEEEEEGEDSLGRRDFLISSSLTAAALLTAASMREENPSSSSFLESFLSNQQQQSTTVSSTTTTKATDNMVLPFSSVRKYRTLTLTNGMRVVLVTDKSIVATRRQTATVALSVGGAGQFADPTDLPGLAHLMEHMVLSCSSSKRQDCDFEEWLNRRDGYSNGFTAYDNVCFHFACPASSLEEGLQRFAALFTMDHVKQVCRAAQQDDNNDNAVLKREVRRVDSELDFTQAETQLQYLTKDFVNPEHPYARFSAGSLDTLERKPKEALDEKQREAANSNADDADNNNSVGTAAGSGVGQRLVDFFETRYQPEEAVLVVISPQDDLQTLERWVSPFADTLSRKKPATESDDNEEEDDDEMVRRRYYPGQFLQGSRYKQMVLCRKAQPSTSSSAPSEDVETLSLEWVLNLDYKGIVTSGSGQPVVTGPQVAFLVAQIFGRKGPGSLYEYLLRRGWVPPPSSSSAASVTPSRGRRNRNNNNAPSGRPMVNGVPRVTLPVDVSGFQLLKLELHLTMEGFLNRAAVVAAVYDSLEAVRNGGSASPRLGGQGAFNIPRELITQWISIATIHGYLVQPRPPDAIELCQDAQLYGIGDGSVGNGEWFRFPSPDNRQAIAQLQRQLAATLEKMSDPTNAVVIATAGPKAVSQANLPSPFRKGSASLGWRTEPITGAQFRYDDMFRLSSRIEELVLTRLITRAELLYPSFNPLIPLTLRPARLVANNQSNEPRKAQSMNPLRGGLVARAAEAEMERPSWIRSLPPMRPMDAVAKGDKENGLWYMLPPSTKNPLMPSNPPEPGARAVWVLQLLSSRPARAGLRQAAQAELWKTSLDLALLDLAELGAPAGLFYDVSFNQYGIRICVLGMSQNLPSYTRRLCRRLVEHSTELQKGPEIFPQIVTTVAVSEARRLRGISQQRRQRLISSLRRSTAFEASAEGSAFLRSCNGAVCFADGDLLPSEVDDLAAELRQITEPFIGNMGSAPAVPEVEDLLYIPNWKPRSISSCSIPGVALISDVCGRVPR